MEWKDAKYTFTVSLTPKYYSFLCTMADKYGISSKSKAIEYAIQKAIAHEQLLEVSKAKDLEIKIQQEAEKQAENLYKAKRLQEKDKKEVIKSKEN